MPRPKLNDGSATVRVIFAVPRDEAERYAAFARETAPPGTTPSVSAMIRRAIHNEMRRHRPAKAGKP